MTIASRFTQVVHGRLAMLESRLAAARDSRHGLQVMSFEQAAVRLAGGFARPIDDEGLRAAIQEALPATPMGELESIKTLPGMIDAAADTLHKAWRAGIDLAARAADHPRLALLEASAPGPYRTYPRTVDGRPEERSCVAGGYGRHCLALAGANAGNQRRQCGDSLSRDHRGDALGTKPASLRRIALGNSHRGRVASRL